MNYMNFSDPSSYKLSKPNFGSNPNSSTPLRALTPVFIPHTSIKHRTPSRVPLRRCVRGANTAAGCRIRGRLSIIKPGQQQAHLLPISCYLLVFLSPVFLLE
jgi:hypothetical protein